MKEKRFYSLSTDSTFKYMFKNEKFKEWFSEIILDKCGIDLMEYELVDSKLNSGNETKDYLLDNLLMDNNHNYIIVEMQNYKADEKNTKYLFRVSGNMLKEGKNKLGGNVILIQFDNYTLKGVDKEILHFVLKEEELNIIKRGIEIYEFILSNFKNKKYNEIDKRLSLFTCKSYEEMLSREPSEKTKEIIKELELLNMDENFSFMYDAEVGRYLELKGAREQGIEIGENNYKKKIVLENIKNGTDKNTLSSILNIPLEEIETILNEEKNEEDVTDVENT